MANNKAISFSVYEKIKDDIIQQRLSGGTPLVEEQLAAKYNVSRTPVREALKLLIADGLVEFYPYHGTLVKTFGPSDIVEIYTIREALEGIMCRDVAGIITDENIDLLEKNQIVSEKALQEGDIDTCNLYGDKLHSVVLDISGNSRIKDILDRYRAQSSYFNVYSKKLPARVKKSVRQHREILEVMKKHDGDEAEKKMRVHVHDTMNDMLASLQNQRTRR